MAKSEPVAKLDADQIVARTARVLDYLATMIENVELYGANASVEAPSDLPMDEATFAATIFLCLEMVDAAEVTPAELRERAAQFRAGISEATA